MDSRTSGSMVASALTAGLTAAGREVWNLGLCPTPAVPLLIRKFGAAGGLMVSASHNPPEDNGIKLQDDEVEWLEDFEKNDEEELENEAETLIREASEFYDREVERYQEDD
jgi:phosphomannomutase